MLSILPSTTYHIYNHANGNDNLFREEANYSYFLSKWKKYINPIAKTYAYCLMPNHFHFLIQIREEKLLADLLLEKKKRNNYNLEGPQRSNSKPSGMIFHSNTKTNPEEDLQGLDYNEKEISNFISQQFSNLFNGYTKAINKRYKRYGSLFTPRFKRKEVLSVSYFYKLLVYIHNNPVNHGFATRMSDWEYTSWHEYHLQDTWIETSWIEDLLGTRDLFFELHNEHG